MGRPLFVFLLVLSAHWAEAQNWQTVHSQDTTYFIAGKHYSYKSWVYYPKLFPPMMDSPILRMAYVSKVSAMGTDTAFRFFTGLRDSSANFPLKCLDTAGPSWLGPMCIRTLTGTEYYFNSRNDTIVLQTHAGVGDSWKLAADSAGRLFIGTISQVGLINIDGAPDSFKSIKIQAYSGGVPVSNPYNAKVLQLSKTHGWIKTLDLYWFPNIIWDGDRKGIVLDSIQHLRLPTAFSKGRMIQRIEWKYAPGNEWIWKLEEGFGFYPDNTPRYVTVRHDSVLSFRLLSPGVGLATIRSVEFKSSHIYISGPPPQYNDASSVTTSVRTDTVRDVIGNPVPVKVENDWRHNSFNRYFAWPFDSVRYFTTRADLAHFETHPVYSNGCMRWPQISAVGDWDHFETYLSDFGQTGKYVLSLNSQNGSIDQAEYGRYIFIKTGNDSFGSKLNVATLSVASTAQRPQFTIVPNPANGEIMISSTTQRWPIQARLRNVSGQCVRNFSFSGQFEMSTQDLSPGLYFLELLSFDVRQTLKVVVQH